MRLGLFPVHVQVGDQRFDTVRVYGTDDRTEVWGLVAGKPAVAATGAGLVKQARALGDRFADGTRAKWTLELADGTTWLVSPAGGCGCSNPLKAFKPERLERGLTP